MKELTLKKILKAINDEISFRFGFISEFLLLHNILTSDRVRYLRYFVIACLLFTMAGFSSYKKEVTINNNLKNEISNKELNLNSYKADNTQLTAYINVNKKLNPIIAEYIDKNLYFSSIYDTFGRFYNYLVMNLELLGFPFKVSYPNKPNKEISDQNKLFLDYTVNQRYKTGFKIINILVSAQMLTQISPTNTSNKAPILNKDLSNSIKRLNSTVFLSQISTLLNLFILDLKSIKYDSVGNVYTLNLTILGN